MGDRRSHATTPYFITEHNAESKGKYKKHSGQCPATARHEFGQITLTVRAGASRLGAVEPNNTESIPLKPQRRAELEDYAQRHGQDPAAALDEVVATYLEWERQDYEEAVEGIRRGYEDVKAGRTRPAAELLEELRAKYGFPR